MAQTGMLDLIANQPSDVPTQETLKFLKSRIPVGATILEIGCGDGQVACELLQRGYRVTGLDSDSEAIARAQAREFARSCIVAEVRQQFFVRCDRLHAFPAPHQPFTPSDRSRPRITKS